MSKPTRKSQLSLEREHSAKSFVMLAHRYSEKKHFLDESSKDKYNILHWRVEEKFDGVRVRWHKGRFYSRTQKVFPTPARFCIMCKKIFGSLPLDGELTMGRGRFQETVSVVRNGASTDYDWMGLHFYIFDLVDFDLCYAKRIEKLQKLPLPYPRFHIVQPIGSVEDETSIPTMHEKIIQEGGEGLILRNPTANYECGRSYNLLKVKPFMEIEATIIDIIPGEGRNENRMGALMCILPNGKTFKVGTGFTDYMRECPPPIGAEITVEFLEYTDAGLPRHPRFRAVRNYE